MPADIQPRRPLDDAYPDLYLESDRDYVLNNLAACVEFLDRQNSEKGKPC